MSKQPTRDLRALPELDVPTEEEMKEVANHVANLREVAESE